jgi:hypothetical protein
MPRFSSLSQPRFVSGDEFLPDERRQVIIERAFEETFRNDPDPKPIITLAGADGWQRDLTINQTNGRVLVAAFGDEMNEWVGQIIEVFAVDTEFNGQPRKGVRVAPVMAETAASPPEGGPIKLPATRDALDDDIPF